MKNRHRAIGAATAVEKKERRNTAPQRDDICVRRASGTHSMGA